MRVSKIAFALSTVLVSVPSYASAPAWQTLESDSLQKKSVINDFPKILSKTERLEQEAYWFNAPLEGQGAQGLKVLLPTPEGKQLEFVIWSSPIMQQGLADRYPNIKTFKGHQVGKPENHGRFDLADGVFHGVYILDGKKVFVDPLNWDSKSEVYQTYYKSDFALSKHAKDSKRSFQCKVKGHEHSALEHVERSLFKSVQQKSTADPINLGDTLRTYRIAVATTGDYGKFFGTKAQAVASVVTSVNRINDVFQSDLSVKLELVADNDKIVFIDPATDPFSDDEGAWIDEGTAEIEKTIGTANYDVGHTYAISGGGLAGLGVVCSSAKAGGFSGIGTPTGDPFHIDYVSHELGHQFNMEHSFNGSAGGCGGNRAGNWAYEPGSGSSIMGYAGICEDDNIQNGTDAHFHVTSIEQAKTHITGSADTCAVKTVTGNAIPTVNAGVDGFIPKETPFKLTAVSTDANSGDTLLYAWEQRDLGDASSGASTLVDNGNRPIFRTWLPTASPTRYLPRLQEVLAGGALVKGEAWPTTTRDLNFVATVRDQKGGINSDATLIKVSADAGPFKAKFPVSSSHWAPESKQYAQWDVANTTAAPISCSTVDIKLSLDDGATFDLLADDTANDGQELLTLPAGKTGDKARFFVECSSQPFFTVTQAFRISSSGASETENPAGVSGNNAPVASNDTYTIDQDSSNNRFDLLANDSDSDGDSLRIASVSNVSNGATATISSDGQFVSYTPASGFNGSAEFDYVMNDGKGGQASGKVAVTVNAAPTNQAPTANNDTFNVAHNASAVSLNVLANDSDPDTTDSIRVSSVSSVTNGASVTIASDGSTVSFTSASGFSGQVTFNYVIEDTNGANSSATVTVTVAAAPAPVTPPAPPSGGSGGGSTNWLLLGLLFLARKLRR